jgi:hypothetical protein
MSDTQLPKIADLYSEIELMQKADLLTALLSQPPKPEWVKLHPYIANYKYLPIDKVEFLLKMIFKKYRIEITGQGTAFNGVFVTVRVHYLNPVTGEWDYHDGIGAKELQVKKGTSPADLSNINSGALAMAFPIAKTVAVKDACDHFGSLFGSDLNRKDVMQVKPDENLQAKSVVDDINDKVAQEHTNTPPPVETPVQATPGPVYAEFEEVPNHEAAAAAPVRQAEHVTGPPAPAPPPPGPPPATLVEDDDF